MPSIRTVLAVLEVLRRLHPEPWYYRRDPIQGDIEFTNLPPVLQHLEELKLVEKAHDPTSGEKAVRLTAQGLEVANDPDPLARLGHADMHAGGELGVKIRDLFRNPATPWMTRGLVALALGLFLVGGFLAYQRGFLQMYLAGFMSSQLDFRYIALIRDQGMLKGEDLLDGGWWRVLASNFVHPGFLFLAMSVYGIWSMGAFMERAWGRFRFLGIVLVSAAWATLTAMAYAPASPAVGLWGIDCGLIGAAAVFALVYHRYLASEVRSSIWWTVGTNAVMMVLIGFMMRGSGGMRILLLGGAIGGAVAALVLSIGRFSGWRWGVIGWIGLPLVIWAAFAWMQHVRVESKEWAEIEQTRLQERTSPRVDNTINRVVAIYQGAVEPLMEQRASRRDPEKVKAAADEMAAGVAKLRELSDELKAAPFRNKEVVEAMDRARAVLGARAVYYAEAVRYLEVGEHWTKDEDKAHEKMWDDVRTAEKALAANKAWKEAIKGRDKRKIPG
jgi:membrane associated rhomboid family serine protease